MKQVLGGIALALSSTALGGIAVAQDAPAIPNIPSDNVMRTLTAPKTPPMLQHLIDSGVRLTYLGNAGGLESYLGESASGMSQTFYLAPDGNHVVAGLLFRDNGVNVTGVQIAEMRDRFNAAEKRAQRLGEDVGAATPLSVPEPKVTTNLAQISADEIAQGVARTPSADEYLSDRPLDDFRPALEDTSWFEIGDENAPKLYYVADPQCPFCHRMWQELRPMIMAREISVRVILIAGLKGSEAKTISLLSREDPGRDFLTGEGSTRTMPVAPPPPASSAGFKNAYRYLESNMRFIEEYAISSTPHMFYFDPEGDLYESKGIPADRSAFFSAMEGRQ
jgi:thiol:disulfide interchange protein DsbG